MIKIAALCMQQTTQIHQTKTPFNNNCKNLSTDFEWQTLKLSLLNESFVNISNMLPFLRKPTSNQLALKFLITQTYLKGAEMFTLGSYLSRRSLRLFQVFGLHPKNLFSLIVSLPENFVLYSFNQLLGRKGTTRQTDNRIHAGKT